jgi:Flp pilus assembly protein TadB
MKKFVGLLISWWTACLLIVVAAVVLLGLNNEHLAAMISAVGMAIVILRILFGFVESRREGRASEDLAKALRG